MQTHLALIKQLTPPSSAASIASGMDEGDDDAKRRERRRALLVDPALAKELRKVARLRGLTKEEARDTAQDVIADALEMSSVPDDPKEARLYLGGIVRNKVGDIFRDRGYDAEHAERERAEPPPDGPTTPEDEASLNSLVAIGSKLFGQKFEWFVRSKVYRQTHAQIATAYKVDEDHVQRSLLQIASGMKASGAVSFILVLLLLFSVWRLRTPGDVNHPRGIDLANTASTGPTAPPVPSVAPAPTPLELAHALRERALRESERGEWDLCLNDSGDATQFDPPGDNLPETIQLRTLCEVRLSPAVKPHP